MSEPDDGNCPIRVCFVVNAIGETSVPGDIAAGIIQHTDVEVDVLAWWQADEFHREETPDIIEIGAPDTRLGLDQTTYRECLDLFADYDLVQAHHCHSGSLAKIIARHSGTPTVSREGNMRRGFTREGRIANGLTNPLSSRVVCNSNAVYRSFRRWERLLLDESRVEIIPNGVDVDRIDDAIGKPLPGVPSEILTADVLVGSAGMLTPQKDHETLIRAVAGANEFLDRDVALVIAGEGDLRGSLEELANELGIGDSVHILGLVEREVVYAMLHQIDVYCMPSRWEGFSAAAVEAIASETPCIFSDISAFTIPYENVALFHPVGDHAALSKRLVELVGDAEKARDLASAGRHLVESTYTIERISNAYADLYRDVLDRPGE